MRIRQKAKGRETNGADHEDEHNDSIATSNTDDMFAFSQIIASGDKVSQVTAEMEKSQTQNNKQDDEDSAILAFSNTLPGNDDEPKVVETDQKKVAEEAKAQEELAALNSNDATSAFGDLVQA